MRNYPTALTDSDPHYYEKQAQHERHHTTVEIQPSHSYEIKQTANGYQTIYNGEQANSHGYHNEHEENAPVIVLRIPGPQKYASHLRSLLQQYLEVRAAQYIQELQEQEHSSHSHYDEHSYNPIPVIPYAQQAYVAPITPVLLHPMHGVAFQASAPDPYANLDGEPHVDIGAEHLSTPSPASYYASPQHLNEDHSGIKNNHVFNLCVLRIIFA